MITAKLSQTERMLSEGKLFIQKIEEDNIKLRRALEHSMTTLSRMSLDSDNSVDRLLLLPGLLYCLFSRLLWLFSDYIKQLTDQIKFNPSRPAVFYF